MQNLDINDGFRLAQIVNLIIIFLCLALPLAGVIVWISRNAPRPIREGGARFENRGTQVTDTFDLAAGTYKMTYRLAVMSEVDLIEVATGNRETLLVKLGSGSIAFTVEQAGRYALEVAPQDDESVWCIEISPLGLP